ncbi:MAG: zf-HC2 domain-containing protein [Archangium sp.]
MSLWWNRKRVEAAVLGELSQPDERKLFEHLRGCEACRAHYDTLSTGMDALSTKSRDEREKARVLAPAVPKMDSPSRPVFVIPLAVGVAAVAFVLITLRFPPAEDEVTWRGDIVDAGEAPFSLLAYARRADGPVRLAADLPLGTGSVSRDERVQFFVKHSQPRARVTVTGTAPDGSSRTLAEAEVGASVEKSSAVGAAIDLSALTPGRWKIEAALQGDGPPLVVHGTLEVKP